jgi:hypothetical protein
MLVVRRCISTSSWTLDPNMAAGRPAAPDDSAESCCGRSVRGAAGGREEASGSRSAPWEDRVLARFGDSEYWNGTGAEKKLLPFCSSFFLEKERVDRVDCLFVLPLKKLGPHSEVVHEHEHIMFLL